MYLSASSIAEDPRFQVNISAKALMAGTRHNNLTQEHLSIDAFDLKRQIYTDLDGLVRCYYTSLGVNPTLQSLVQGIVYANLFAVKLLLSLNAGMQRRAPSIFHACI